MIKKQSQNVLPTVCISWHKLAQAGITFID